MYQVDKFVKRWDNSAASLARARFERGERSPYRTHPERESYFETEQYQRPDGTEYTSTRSVDRWAGSFSFGEWVIEELAPTVAGR